MKNFDGSQWGRGGPLLGEHCKNERRHLSQRLYVAQHPVAFLELLVQLRVFEVALHLNCFAFSPFLLDLFLFALDLRTMLK